MSQCLKCQSQCKPPPKGALLHAQSSRTIGLYAIQALHQELAAYPKPGLVSPVDSGSHVDMDAALFFRSLFALRHYFSSIAAAGMQDASFVTLKQMGLAAEERMMRATLGVNTHRGAIFNLGLLAAAAGSLVATDQPLQNNAIAECIKSSWGDEIRSHGAALPKTSHGRLAASRYGVGGALHEASSGFPHVFNVGLPALQECRDRGTDKPRTAVHCLFRLMESLPDTNLLYRGGDAGLRIAQRSAREFLAAGSVHRPGWETHAIMIHRQFVSQNLSPGGSADLLAATLFVGHLQCSKGFDSGKRQGELLVSD